MKKRNEFSSFDVAKALDISIERMRQWMNLGFITATIPAKGQGTKAIFTREDVYRAGLFLTFIENGMNRGKASYISNLLLNSKRIEISFKELLGQVFTIQEILEDNRKSPPKKEILLVVIIQKNIKDDAGIKLLICRELPDLCEITINPETNERIPWKQLIIVNIQQLAGDIDARLHE